MGGVGSAEALEAVRCMLLRMLETVESKLRLLERLEVLEAMEVMRCVLLHILDAVEGGLYLLEMLGMCWRCVGGAGVADGDVGAF